MRSNFPEKKVGTAFLSHPRFLGGFLEETYEQFARSRGPAQNHKCQSSGQCHKATQVDLGITEALAYPEM